MIIDTENKPEILTMKQATKRASIPYGNFARYAIVLRAVPSAVLADIYIFRAEDVDEFSRKYHAGFFGRQGGPKAPRAEKTEQP
jgi:hypothetical protein